MILPSEDPAGWIVDTFITEVASPVFKNVFDGGHAEHEDDWHHRDLFAESVDGRNPIEQHDEEEVEVGEPVKLFEQVLR